MQRSVLLFRGMEYEIDLATQQRVSRLDIAQLNRAISRTFDELTTLLHDLETRAHRGTSSERTD